MKKIRLLQFSDLHIGHNFVTDRDILELKKALLTNIEDSANTFILFTGDLFHTNVNLDSKASIMAMDFLKFLNEIGVRVVIIRGTRSHEYDYIDAVTPNGNNLFENIKFVSTLEVIKFRMDEGNDFSILGIPEEYMEDKFTYYKDYLNPDKYYNVIMFHGTVGDVAKFNSFIEQEPYRKAPIFSKAEFWQSSNIVLSGHIHEEQEYFNNKNQYFNYCGSWCRMSHGSESLKMMKVIDIEEDIDCTYHVKKVTNIINDSTPKFLTYNINYISKENNIVTVSYPFTKELINTTTLEELPNLLTKISTNDNNQYRYLFKTEFPTEFYKSINKVFFDRSNVKLVYEKQEKERITENESVLEQITKLQELSMEEQIKEFLKKNNNVELNINDIIEIIN